MSMHTEWDTATGFGFDVYTADEANESLTPGEEVTSPYVLVLGGAGGGCLAIEGTADELRAWIVKVHDHVMATVPDRSVEEEACCDWSTSVPGTPRTNG